MVEGHLVLDRCDVFTFVQLLLLTIISDLETTISSNVTVTPDDCMQHACGSSYQNLIRIFLTTSDDTPLT